KRGVRTIDRWAAKSIKPRKTGHFAEMGWRSTVATIRMQLQVFARIVEVIAEVHGFSRLGQHSHLSGRRSGDGGHPVEPARAALRGAAAVGVPPDRHAGGRCRAGPAQLR